MTKTCAKVAFTSRNQARNRARSIERHGKQMREYECQNCFQWHLTSQVHAERRRNGFGNVHRYYKLSKHAEMPA